MSDGKPLFAAVLSAVVPGLGHAYLGAWGRSLVWFATVLMAATLIGAEAGVDPAAADSVGGLVETLSSTVSPLGAASVVLLLSANVIDAFRLGQQIDHRRAPDSAAAGLDSDSDATTSAVECPDCGRNVDADLDFCHWCTTEFDEE